MDTRKGNKELDKGLLYLSLHKLLIKKYGVGRIIDKKNIFITLGQHYLVPKNLRPLVIKEMEDREFIKKENKATVKILESKLDIEEDKSKIFKSSGLF